VDPFASPKWVGGLKQLVGSIHQNGAAIGIQLWTGNELPGGDKVAPSPKDDHREVTAGELGELIQRFAVPPGRRGTSDSTPSTSTAPRLFSPPALLSPDEPKDRCLRWEPSETMTFGSSACEPSERPSDPTTP